MPIQRPSRSLLVLGTAFPAHISVGQGAAFPAVLGRLALCPNPGRRIPALARRICLWSGWRISWRISPLRRSILRPTAVLAYAILGRNDGPTVRAVSIGPLFVVYQQVDDRHWPAYEQQDDDYQPASGEILTRHIITRPDDDGGIGPLRAAVHQQRSCAIYLIASLSSPRGLMEQSGNRGDEGQRRQVENMR